jgi:sugar/nucleoside kinase (ribokinase family)
MRIAFVGHVSVDRNVVGGVESTLHGGAVVHGGITACRLGAEVSVYTMCGAEAIGGFGELAEAGARVTFLPSAESTSIRNEYPSQNPDERRSAVVSRARPFEAGDLARIEPCDVLHVNALWAGEFPAELLPRAKTLAGALAGDAQGFLRHVEAGGAMVHRDWAGKSTWLPLFDVFKVDIAEARVLTGLDEPRAAVRAVRQLGPGVVILTHRDGLCVDDGETIYEAAFGPYGLEGRTGRGDTCMAAFLVAQAEGADRAPRGERLRAAAERAAEVATRKMQYPGPYRG